MCLRWYDVAGFRCSFGEASSNARVPKTHLLIRNCFAGPTTYALGFDVLVWRLPGGGVRLFVGAGAGRAQVPGSTRGRRIWVCTYEVFVCRK